MPRIRWLIIWMCFIGNAISYIDRTNLAIAAPLIRHDLGLDAAAMGLVLSAFFWTYAAMQLPAGWIIDRIGVRLSLALAVGWWSLFTIATGFARGISQFIGARLMLGVGEAASLPSFTKVAFNWFPRRERGLACSIFNSGSTAGSALSIPLVTWLIVIVGWRGAFIVTGLLGIVWVALWWFVYRDPERHRAIAPAEVDALLAERAAPAPATTKISWGDLFRYRSIWGLMIGMFCLNFAIYFFITWFPSYMLQARGFSLTSFAGLGMAPALSAIAGYCVCNDVSERAFQLERGGQWDKGKGCDTFGPVGPWLVTADEFPEALQLGMWLDVNGVRMQTGNTRTMIFGVPRLVSYLSMFMTLEPGDIITTGTPPGVGLGRKRPVYLRAGDTMRLGIDRLGEQRQSVVAWRAQAAGVSS